jgi:hypothetical protein
MSLSCRWLVLGIAISLVVASMPFAVLGQERTEPQPLDEDFKEQTKRLSPKNCKLERLEAVEWLKRHAEAKNAQLAIPALERCIRDDPEATIREAAVLGLGMISKKRKDPCPLVITEAMLDKDEFVSQMADGVAGWFKTYAPGSVEVLLRCAKSEDPELRAKCLTHLARAGGKDKKVLEAIEKAKKDESFGVRHNAHCALFQATDNLADFLGYLIRLEEDPEGVLGKVDADSEAGKLVLTRRNLGRISAAVLVAEWSDKRPDDLAPALLKLLASPSPEMRRGAARLIGISAAKVDLTDYDVKNLLEPPLEPAKCQKPPQKSNVAVRFEKLKAEDRLRELCDDDPDRTVRAAARTALHRLATLQEKDAHR